MIAVNNRGKVRRSRRRQMIIAVALGVTTLSLYGCGSSGTNATGASSGAGGSTGSAKSGGSGGAGSGSGKSIVLTEEDYYTSGSSSTFWPKLFAEYHKLHPNITIKRTTVPQAQYVPHLLDQAGGSALPDIVMIDNPYVAQFAKSGVLTPLTSIGPINTSEVAPTELYDGVYKGKLYAIPPYTNTIALAYNKKIFAAAHMRPPKTWAQLVSDAKALTTPSRWGFEVDLSAQADGAFWGLAPFLWTNAGADATNDINSPAAVAALNLFVKMERDGSMPKAEVSWLGTQDTEYFEEGKAAMTLNGSWNIAALNAVKGLSYGTVEIPVPSPSKKLLVPTGGETWTIPQSDSPAAKQAALQLFRWLLTPSVDAKEAIGQGGLIPTVKGAVAPAVKAEDPAQITPYAEELQNGGTPRTRYLGTGFDQITTTIGNAIDSAVVGPTTAKQAFDSIAATVKSELKSVGEG